MKILFALLLTAQVWGMETMSAVREALAEAGPDTLVVWDVDMVLMQPREPAFHMTNMGRHKVWFRKAFGALNSDEQAIAFCLCTIRAEAELIEPEVLEILSDLQTREIPHIACTACLTGPLDEVEALEDFRIARLAELGITFNPPIEEEMVLSELPLYRGYPSLYKKEGIIFANGVKGPKGDALVAFLQRLDRSFSRIIFIDDRQHHLEAVEKKLQSLGIDFTGIHYTGAKYVDSPPVGEKEFVATWNELIERARCLTGD